MKGIISHRTQNDYVANMRTVFSAINNVQLKYNWLITDYECNDYPTDQIPSYERFVWMSGAELTEIVNIYNIQFIWGTFCAFLPTTSLETILQHPLPSIQDNNAIWSKNVHLQHPLAELEIDAFDSSATILITGHKENLDAFIGKFSQSIDLSQHNS